eukprot:scaffold8183_cov122-Isochrysis_galbana.AAC.1
MASWPMACSSCYAATDAQAPGPGEAEGGLGKSEHFGDRAAEGQAPPPHIAPSNVHWAFGLAGTRLPTTKERGYNRGARR